MRPARVKPSGTLAVVYRPLRALIPYAKNARRHSAGQITKIKASLMEFGWANAMLTAEHEMIAGHARLAAALALLEEGQAIPHTADPAMGPTIDLSHLTAPQRRAYVLADNRLAEEAIWDLDLLRGEIEGLKLDGNFDIALAGFGDDEVSTIMSGWNADFSRQEATAAVLDPLLAWLRIKYPRADHDAVLGAVRTALAGFAGVEITA
jgi:hypothetical protein